MLQTISFYGFLTTILLAPLPLGSNQPSTWTLLALLMAVWVLLDALPYQKNDKEERQFLQRIAPIFCIFALLCAWIVFQTIDLGPASHLAHPLWSETSALFGVTLPHSISLNVVDTYESLMILLTYGATFWLAARFFRTISYAKTALKSFMIASLLYAFYGLLIYFLDLKVILWFDKTAYLNDVTSTFINRNTYATYAGLGTVVSIALLFESIGDQLRGNLTQREILRLIIDNISKKAWLPFVALLLNATALLQTHSRGGFLAFCFALLILIIGLTVARLLPKKLLITSFAILGFGTFFAFSMSSDLTLQRLENTSFENSMRDEVFALTWQAIQNSPVLGTGYGTYEEAFKAYKNNDIRVNAYTWDKAHNTYLEIAMELGIPAISSIIILLMICLGLNLKAVFKRKRRQLYPIISASVIILVAVHALVDFSLQIPGFTVSFLFLAGMGWAQSWSDKRKSRKRT